MHTVILLPGLASDATMWLEQLPVLSTRHLVHVTDVHFRHETMPEMAAALLAECPGPLVLVGASMGGMLAMEAARQDPARVQAIALLGSSARPDTTELKQLRRDAIVMFKDGRMQEVIEANVFFAFHPSNSARRDLTDTYLAFVTDAGAAQLVRQNRALMERIDSRPSLQALRCPLLVACGEADLLTPPEHSREIAALVPHARLEIVPGAGHMLTMEQPARVNALLLAWLDSLPQPRTSGV